MPDLLFAVLVVAAAMFVRGFTGFGGALLTVPFLSLIWGVEDAVVVVAVLQAVSGAILARRSRLDIAWRELRLVGVWSLIGLAVGTLALATVPVRWIAIALGIFSLGVGLRLAIQRQRTLVVPRPSTALTAGAGSLAGLLHGMVGTGGPVIVPFLHRLLPNSAALRSTLLMYFLGLDLIRLAGYGAFGIADLSDISRSLILIPIAIGFGLLGGRLHVEVSERIFRLTIAALLILAGLLLLT